MIEDLSYINCKDLLESIGIVNITESNGEISFSCPSSDHFHGDNNPSARMNSRTSAAVCHGCLAYDEKIVTNDGLVPICEVSIGDKVIGLDGKQDTVIDKVEYKKPVIKITTLTDSHGIELTQDHICCVVKKDTVLAAVTGVVKKGQYGIGISGREIRSYLTKHNILFEKASNIKVGDFFITPVIDIESRNNNPIGNYIRATNKGSQSKKINCLPVDKEAAWVYGLWLAEGSCSTRGIRVDLHRLEKNYADRFANFFMDRFGIKASISYKGDNSQYVTVNNVDLEHLFRDNFGNGSDKKKIPYAAWFWNSDIQQSLIEGYICGDGRKDGKSYNAKTVSEDLAYGIWHLCIQSGNWCSISGYQPKISHGVKSRKYTYCIRISYRNSMKGFYGEIGKIKYYFQMVNDISILQNKIDVIDISINTTNTFLTKTFATHNCGWRGNAISFLAWHKSIPITVARRLLEERYSAGENAGVANLEEEVVRIMSKEKKVEELARIAPDDSWLDNFYIDWNCENYTGYENIMEYIFNRGFKPKILDKWMIGYDSYSDRITIPIFNATKDALVGFKGRAWKDHSVGPKYMILGDNGKQNYYGFQPYQKSKYVFGIDTITMIDISAKNIDAIIVEGELNVIAMDQYGLSAIGIAGSEFSETQRDIIKSHVSSATIYLDNDKAGNEGTKKVVEMLSPYMSLRVVQNAPGDAADLDSQTVHELISSAEPALLLQAQGKI